MGRTVQPNSEPVVPVATVPFEFPRNQVLLPVTIRGEGPFFFILDTGVDPSVVDLALARGQKLPLDTTRSGEASGGGTGSVRIYPATLSDLRIDEAPIEDFSALAMDLGPLSQRLGRQLHGILGHSFLTDRIVQIDYPARVMRILPRDFRPPAGAAGQRVLQVPLVFRDDDIIPMVEVRVNGWSVPVSLDTGSSLTLEIFDSSIERLGLQRFYESAQPGEVAGARGAFEVRRGPVDSIALGPFVLLKPEVTFSRRTASATAGRLGNLGNGALQDFVVTLDYRNRLITIAEPPPGTATVGRNRGEVSSSRH